MDRSAESNRFLLDAWDVMSHGSADFERMRGELIDVSWSGQPVIFFNVMLTNRTPSTLKEFEDAVRARVKWAQERKQPWMFAVSHETMGGLMEEAGAVLDRLGFTAMMPLTGMETDR